MNRSTRIVYALAGLGLLFSLLVARWLVPDLRGVGTHEQLGLAPCMTLRLFHIPCPFCGMTTSFSLMAHGDVRAAIHNQPAGALTFLLCGIGGLGMVVAALLGKGLPARLQQRVRSRVWFFAGTTLFAAWLYKIALHLRYWPW